MRESPSFILMDLFRKHGALVSYYDPYIPVVTPTREHAHWTGHQSVKWTASDLKRFDAVVVSTAHRSVDYQQLAQWAKCIVDTRNALAVVKTKKDQVWKA
jgi:UDP-N-acetyl-D-glucosamine dehydrogenase